MAKNGRPLPWLSVDIARSNSPRDICFFNRSHVDRFPVRRLPVFSFFGIIFPVGSALACAAFTFMIWSATSRQCIRRG